MNEYFVQFNQFLLPYGFNNSELVQLNQMCEIVTFNKGDTPIKAGVKQSHLYFICKGIIRNYVFAEDGEIKTYSFRMENMVASGYSNYNYAENLKAKVSVECLEPCIMVKVPNSAISFMIENTTVGDKVGRYLAEAHVLELVDLILDIDTKTLLERYNSLDIKFPNIHQRVAQHIIASYLGTTAVHLSRIKNAKTIR